MGNRVTIQDIADELGLSRNTVSKAINNTGVLAEATRQRVLAKAIEMGYKQFTYLDMASLKKENDKDKKDSGEIALLTASFLDHSHFASSMLDRFQSEVSQLGYSMSIHNISAADLRENRLPASFRKDTTVGIVCIEVFDLDYCRMLSGLGLPLLLIDAPVITDGEALNADLLLMDNTSGILSFIHKMRERKHTRIGFAGDIRHCTSFFERYMAFRNGMFYNGLPINEAYCLTENSDEAGYSHNREYLKDHLSRLSSLPDVCICANDFIAIDLLQAMEQLGLRCPEDMMILGFDDSSESRICSPKLSTVHIHSQVIGFSAVQLLISRIRDPGLDFRKVYVETDLILRASTGDGPDAGGTLIRAVKEA